MDDVEFERVSFNTGDVPDELIRQRVAQLAPNAEIGKRGKYAMGLNPTDLVTIVHALGIMAWSDDGEYVDQEDRDNAEGLRGDILETLNIEEI